MKKIVLAIATLACSSSLFAQQTAAQQAATQQAAAQPPAAQTAADQANAEPPFKRFPTLPPFHLLKLDSATYLTKEDVKKNRRTIIMYFSPDCDHCKHQTESILADFSKFKDIEIIMATYQPFEELKNFNEHYRMAEHPNIKMGRDEKFFLPPFYKIRNLPYLALYDKKGNLITTFEGAQKIDTILAAFDKKGS